MSTGRLRDMDVRLALRAHLSGVHAGDDDTLIIEELALSHGHARIDVAVLNGTFSGYEIKSESDTLVRLPRQQAAYSAVFDAVTIVVGGNHAEAVSREVPTWWGITCVFVNDAHDVEMREIRPAEPNPGVDVLALVQLLWRDEALAILADHDADDGMARQPRRAVWQRVTEVLDAEELRLVVRQQLKGRGYWRSASPPMSRGGSSRAVAKS